MLFKRNSSIVLMVRYHNTKSKKPLQILFFTPFILESKQNGTSSQCRMEELLVIIQEAHLIAKRLAKRQFLKGTLRPISTDLYNWALYRLTEMSVMFASSKEYEREQDRFLSRSRSSSPIEGTRKFHCFTTQAAGAVTTKSCSHSGTNVVFGMFGSEEFSE